MITRREDVYTQVLILEGGGGVEVEEEEVRTVHVLTTTTTTTSLSFLEPLTVGFSVRDMRRHSG